MEKTRFTTYVTKDIKDKLEQLSENTRVPQAKYIQEALEDLIEKYKKEDKK